MAGARRGAAELLRDLDRRVLPALANSVVWMRRGARRRRFLTVAGSTLAVLVTIGLVYVVNRAPAVPVAFHAVVNIGVAQGDSVPQYVADRAAALRQIAATASGKPMYALVTLVAYETPKQLVGSLAGLHVTTVFMRDRAAGTVGPDAPVVTAQAYRIPTDVETAMLARANHDRGVAADLHSMAGQVTGATAEATELRARYRAREATTTASEHAYRSLCACVFAAVVYGTAQALVAASARPAVRVVDAQPGLQSLDRVIFRPPLPEETTVTGDWPADRE